MNLVDAEVTKVLSVPIKRHRKWWVKVEYISHGRKSEQMLMCSTKKKAEKIEKGYKFQT